MNTAKKMCVTLIKHNVYLLELQSELNSECTLNALWAKHGSAESYSQDEARLQHYCSTSQILPRLSWVLKLLYCPTELSHKNQIK